MEYLSWNTNVPWSQQIIDKYNDRFNWNYLSANSAILWSIDMVKTWEHKINFERLSNNIHYPGHSIRAIHKKYFRRDRKSH
ncbi:MAG: hypothetical protein M3Q58_05905 [Bacteroidota bacterium]|nr:hypothetical protein [Bacteroidota bacterium]